MPLYKNVSGKFKKLNLSTPGKEKILQRMVQENLKELLEMHFLEEEYTTTFGGRIDTLAVDFLGAPVIIEYKLHSNENVINQALSYLRWLKAQKVDFFEMLVLKKLGKEVANKLTIDWKNPRVICIADSYNRFDIDTVEVVPLRIELYQYRYYENEILSLEPLTINVPKTRSSNTAEVKPTDELPPDEPAIDEIISKASPTIAEVFRELRQRIFELENGVTEKITKKYIAYRLSKTFVEAHVHKNDMMFLLRPITYNDPKNLVEKVPDSYAWTLNSRVYLKSEDDLEYVFSLIEQSFNDVL